MTESKRILIVDDDARVLLILSDILARGQKNYKIKTAMGGAEALKMIEEQPFDLVITDVRMPGVDGIQLTRSIRSAEIDTQVVWITAYGSRYLETELDTLRVFRCLDKPIRIDMIRQTVMDALGNNFA